jgi:hypothetical protein
MAAFTTRIELHSAEWTDYENLHKYMEQQGFSRIISSDDGTVYHLPTSEYDFTGHNTAAEVLAKAKYAANRTGCQYGILVTEAKLRIWIGLPIVSRQPARRRADASNFVHVPSGH